MDIQAIKDAVTAKPELLDGLVLYVAETDKGKALIDNKAKALSEANIGEEIKKVHSRYDEDVFAILGDRPKTIDGKLEKSYDMVKRHLENLKRLAAIETNLNEADVVKQKNAEIEKLKLEGGGKMFQEQLEQAKKDFLAKEEEYKTKLEEAQKGATDGQVKNDIAVAVAGLKLNPDLTPTMRALAIEKAEAELLKNSKIVDGKVVYLKPDGTTLLNAKYEPASAAEALAGLEVVKEISLKETPGKTGGEAPPGSGGNVQTVKVEGKDDAKKLIFETGTAFTSKTDFIEKSEKALLASGFTRGDSDWDKLKNEAYIEHKVSELPAE